MRRFFSKITVVDCVVVLAILLILAAIVMPSFVDPDGKPIHSYRAQQTVATKATH